MPGRSCIGTAVVVLGSGRCLLSYFQSGRYRRSRYRTASLSLAYSFCCECSHPSLRPPCYLFTLHDAQVGYAVRSSAGIRTMYVPDDHGWSVGLAAIRHHRDPDRERLCHSGGIGNCARNTIKQLRTACLHGARSLGEGRE